MTQTPTDALRLVPIDQLADLIQQADDGFGYSMEMVRLVDGVLTYRLKIAGQDALEITDGDDNDYDAQQACYRLINAAKNKVRADAVRTALAAAPASPLPGGGDMDWQSVAMWMGFSASVIKNGEPWSDQCQQHYDEAKAAFARLAAPTGEPK